MPKIVPANFIGVGVIWNAGDNVELGNQGEMGFNYPIEALTIPAGDAFTRHRVPTEQGLTGRIGFREVYAALHTALISGSSASNTIKHVDRDGPFTVPGTPYEITLTGSAIPEKFGETYAPIKVVDSNGVVYKQVAGPTPTTGEFVDNADGTLLFAAADTGRSSR